MPRTTLTRKDAYKPPSPLGTSVASPPLTPQMEYALRALAKILGDIATSTVRRKEHAHAPLA
ncbi:MAG: hypothetical protein H0X24_22225 [Ktedonobacterales bacterium]|nr:hypothetical protein [Ktedonobacterales bacterium]